MFRMYKEQEMFDQLRLICPQATNKHSFFSINDYKNNNPGFDETKLVELNSFQLRCAVAGNYVSTTEIIVIVSVLVCIIVLVLLLHFFVWKTKEIKKERIKNEWVAMQASSSRKTTPCFLGISSPAYAKTFVRAITGKFYNLHASAICTQESWRATSQAPQVRRLHTRMVSSQWLWADLCTFIVATITFCDCKRWIKQFLLKAWTCSWTSLQLE